jgi:hypothetical protein
MRRIVQAEQPGRPVRPNRQASESFVFEVEGFRFTVTVSRFDDGRVSEPFLNNHRHGNQVDTNARDSAIVLSFPLQHGADPDAIRKALCRDGRRQMLAAKTIEMGLPFLGIAPPAREWLGRGAGEGNRPLDIALEGVRPLTISANILTKRYCPTPLIANGKSASSERRHPYTGRRRSPQ